MIAKKLWLLIASTALRQRIWSRKSNIQWYILSAEITLTDFLPFSSRKLSLEVGRNDWGRLDYTAIHKIWVSLISITKWQETSVNKSHEHSLLIIFIIYHWFTYIFLYTDSKFFNDAVKDFWRDYRQVCALRALRLRLISYYICGKKKKKKALAESWASDNLLQSSDSDTFTSKKMETKNTQKLRNPYWLQHKMCTFTRALFSSSLLSLFYFFLEKCADSFFSCGIRHIVRSTESILLFYTWLGKIWEKICFWPMKNDVIRRFLYVLFPVAHHHKDAH